MISQGDSEIGASKLTGEIMDIVTKIQLAVQTQMIPAGSVTPTVSSVKSAPLLIA